MREKRDKIEGERERERERGEREEGGVDRGRKDNVKAERATPPQWPFFNISSTYRITPLHTQHTLTHAHAHTRERTHVHVHTHRPNTQPPHTPTQQFMPPRCPDPIYLRHWEKRASFHRHVLL